MTNVKKSLTLHVETLPPLFEGIIGASECLLKLFLQSESHAYPIPNLIMYNVVTFPHWLYLCTVEIVEEKGESTWSLAVL
ncbi:hypothetical protein D2Q93_12675 [Alicyclobacillaceae bacterium I2511]|nr:hypothetical protein D2Q93_12675 [Alicyclobacillaceae bacterium I2511]